MKTNSLLANDDDISMTATLRTRGGEPVDKRKAMLFRVAMICDDVKKIPATPAAIGARIRNIRENRLGLTQETFAKLLNVGSKATVSMWEKGEHLPNDPAILVRIAAYGGVAVDYLLTGRRFLIAPPTANLVPTLMTPYNFLLVPTEYANPASMPPLYFKLLENRLDE